ncbi:MAG: hypothetical protein J3K34DRAFT_519742 [Monoraphidium minutum]|nr:MAG: hypothetical protein J3K34DRAFT_519742 [Monoraphidium minutum]
MAGGAPIAVSLRARGLIAFSDAPLLPRGAGPRASARALSAAAARQANRQLASLFCALIAAAASLPPWAWFSAALCSLAAIFFVASRSAALTDGLVVQYGLGVWGLVLWMAAAGVARRDRGAALLGKVKAGLVNLDALARAQPRVGGGGGELGGHSGGSSGGGGDGDARDELRAASMKLMEGFSWGVLSSAASPAPGLYKLSRDIGMRLRRVQAAVAALGAAAGRAGGGAGGGVLAAAMLQQARGFLVGALHDAVEGLSALKELRTPLLLRAAARNNVVLVAPLLTGSALAGLARSAPGAGAVVWSVAAGCMLQLLLASLLAAATHLEDPFASPHADALSLWEARDGLGFMLYGEGPGGWGDVSPGGGGGGGGAPWAARAADEEEGAAAAGQAADAAAETDGARGTPSKQPRQQRWQQQEGQQQQQQQAAAAGGGRGHPEGSGWSSGAGGRGARGGSPRQGGGGAAHMPPMPSLGG